MSTFANAGRSPQRNLLVSPVMQGFYAALGLHGNAPGVNLGTAAVPGAVPGLSAGSVAPAPGGWGGGPDAAASGGVGAPVPGGDPAWSLPPMGGGEPYGLGSLGGLPYGAWPGLSPWPAQALPFGASPWGTPAGMPFGPMAGGLYGGMPGLTPFGPFGGAPYGQSACG